MDRKEIDLVIVSTNYYLATLMTTNAKEGLQSGGGRVIGLSYVRTTTSQTFIYALSASAAAPAIHHHRIESSCHAARAINKNENGCQATHPGRPRRWRRMSR